MSLLGPTSSCERHVLQTAKYENITLTLIYNTYDYGAGRYTECQIEIDSDPAYACAYEVPDLRVDYDQGDDPPWNALLQAARENGSYFIDIPHCKHCRHGDYRVFQCDQKSFFLNDTLVFPRERWQKRFVWLFTQLANIVECGRLNLDL